MDHRDELQLGTYFKSMDNVFIYITNLSPYYVFSVLVSILAVISVCWYRTIDKNSHVDSTENDNEEEEQQENDEELKTSDMKSKESLHSIGNNLTKAANNDEIFLKDIDGHQQETTCSQDTMYPPKDIPGGDGNFEQFSRETERLRSTEALDQLEECATLPSPITRFKRARQAAILEKLTSDMSEQQLKEEKEAEASQIAAIWDLLKQQEDQFNIGTEEELRSQLHLYR